MYVLFKIFYCFFLFLWILDLSCHKIFPLAFILWLVYLFFCTLIFIVIVLALFLQTVMYDCVRNALKKTGTDPKSIDILVVNCSLFSPTPSLCSMVSGNGEGEGEGEGG
jgi:hypothetical protein